MKSVAAKTLCLLGVFLCCTFASDAASISGNVTGADGEPFRVAFVEAQNLRTKITVSVP